MAGQKARVLAPPLLLVQERDFSSCQVALGDGSRRPRRPEWGIWEAPQLFVMELVVWGRSGGGAAFQGLRGRSLWRGLGWEVKGDFLFCETFGMGCVPLNEGNFSEQAKNTLLPLSPPEPGWTVQMASSEVRVGRDLGELGCPNACEAEKAE